MLLPQKPFRVHWHMSFCHFEANCVFEKQDHLSASRPRGSYHSIPNVFWHNENNDNMNRPQGRTSASRSLKTQEFSDFSSSFFLLWQRFCFSFVVPPKQTWGILQHLSRIYSHGYIRLLFTRVAQTKATWQRLLSLVLGSLTLVSSCLTLSPKTEPWNDGTHLETDVFSSTQRPRLTRHKEAVLRKTTWHTHLLWNQRILVEILAFRPLAHIRKPTSNSVDLKNPWNLKQ